MMLIAACGLLWGASVTLGTWICTYAQMSAQIQNFVRIFDLFKVYKQTRDLRRKIRIKILYPEMAPNQNLNA